MAKRVLISGRMRNKKQHREAAIKTPDDAVIVQVQLVGEAKERFLRFKSSSEFKPSNAKAGELLILRGLDQVEAPPAAAPA